MKKLLNKKNIKYYLIYFFIIELVSQFNFIRGVISFLQIFIESAFNCTNFENFIRLFITSILFLVLFFSSLIILTLPITIFLLARKTADATLKRENSKYTSRENIIYYREKISGVSPTTISLIQNLEIEEDKDLTAIIMKMQLNNNIAIEGDTIKLLSEDVSNLSPNEQQLFYILTSEKINKAQLKGWKDVAVSEAIRDGYLKEKNPSKNLKLKKILLFVLLILFFLIILRLKDDFTLIANKFDSLELTEENITLSEFVEHKDFNVFYDLLSIGLPIIFCGIGILGWPIFYFVFIVRYKSKNLFLKRTVKGEQLTDIILGMKNFIHDFSLLSEADKNDILLWDEFLVYAIVLEENTKIIEEILNLKKVNLFDSKMIDINN